MYKLLVIILGLFSAYVTWCIASRAAILAHLSSKLLIDDPREALVKDLGPG